MILLADPTQPATPPAEPTPPQAPKLGAMLIVFVLIGLLFYNLYLDAQSTDYDGKYVTFTVAGLIAGILSIDVSRFWRGKGGDQ